MIQNVIMNKYIKTDIDQGIQYLKVGIMNALAAIESDEEEEIILGDYVPLNNQMIGLMAGKLIVGGICILQMVEKMFV